MCRHERAYGLWNVSAFDLETSPVIQESFFGPASAFLVTVPYHRRSLTIARGYLAEWQEWPVFFRE